MKIFKNVIEFIKWKNVSKFYLSLILMLSKKELIKLDKNIWVISV